jgi:hypothetical protein
MSLSRGHVYIVSLVTPDVSGCFTPIVEEPQRVNRSHTFVSDLMCSIVYLKADRRVPRRSSLAALQRMIVSRCFIFQSPL